MFVAFLVCRWCQMLAERLFCCLWLDCQPECSVGCRQVSYICRALSCPTWRSTGTVGRSLEFVESFEFQLTVLNDSGVVLLLGLLGSLRGLELNINRTLVTLLEVPVQADVSDAPILFEEVKHVLHVDLLREVLCQNRALRIVAIHRGREASSISSSVISSCIS